MSDPKERENNARVTLYLPSELLERVKVKAAKEKRRPNAVMVEALRQVLGGEEE